MVCVDGDIEESARFIHYLPIFHIPILGGWRRYVVLNPGAEIHEWRVGWCAGVVQGVSRLTVTGPARLLLGDSPVSFFGIDAETHKQIPIEIIGTGVIGDGGLYRDVPLL